MQHNENNKIGCDSLKIPNQNGQRKSSTPSMHSCIWNNNIQSHNSHLQTNKPNSILPTSSSSSSISHPSSSQSNSAQKATSQLSSSAKTSLEKNNKTKKMQRTAEKRENVQQFGIDDSDAATVTSKDHNNTAFFPRNDSETSSGASSESFSFHNMSFGLQVQLKEPLQSKKESLSNECNQGESVKVDKRVQDDSAMADSYEQAPNQTLPNKQTHSEEAPPFRYIFEWNTFCSDTLIIKSMTQIKQQQQQEFSQKQNLVSSGSSSISSYENLPYKKVKPSPTHSSAKKDQSGSAESEMRTAQSGMKRFHQDSVDDGQIEEIAQNNYTLMTLLTPSIRRRQEITSQHQMDSPKKLFKTESDDKARESNDKFRESAATTTAQTQQQLFGVFSQGKEKEFSQFLKSAEKEPKQNIPKKRVRPERKYYYQDEEIVNYVGDEFQAVIPNIVQGYRPQLYRMKYEHSKVSSDDFSYVKHKLHQAFGKHITDEDVANIISEANYDMKEVAALLEKNKHYYMNYFTNQRRLQNQRKGQIKRIGTLKRKRKNVLTL